MTKPLTWILCLAWLAGCGGGAGAPALAPPAPAPTPTPTPPTPTPTPTPPAGIGNTGFISQPPVVTQGMTGIIASVPVQTGASWTWSLTGGSVQGPLRNAAITLNAGSGPTLRSQCAITQGTQTVTYYQDSYVVPPATPAPAFYGPGLNADALANTQVGGPGGNQVAQRFRAQFSGPLLAVRVFFIWDFQKAGYFAGTGGSVRLDLLADDGSPAHLPTGPALASVSYGQILASDYYPKLTFPTPASLTQGSLYHLCFVNTDPNPSANYVSVDSLYTDAQLAPAQPVSRELDSATLYRPAGGSWIQRAGFTPIAEYSFAAGSQGTGYMEVWSGNPKLISGLQMVRERFTVSGPAVTASAVLVRLRRESGTGPLTLRLEQADGTLVETVQVPAANTLLGASHWVRFPFAAARTLATARTYHLILSAGSDASYSAFPYRKGTDKGFSASTLFLDGYAQFTSTGATGWSGWDQWGQSDRRDSDLQFYFVP